MLLLALVRVHATNSPFIRTDFLMSIQYCIRYFLYGNWKPVISLVLYAVDQLYCKNIKERYIMYTIININMIECCSVNILRHVCDWQRALIRRNARRTANVTRAEHVLPISAVSPERIARRLPLSWDASETGTRSRSRSSEISELVRRAKHCRYL